MRRELRWTTGHRGAGVRWMAAGLGVLLVVTGPVVPADPARAADEPLRRVIVELTGPAAITAVPAAAGATALTLDAATAQRLAAARQTLSGQHRTLLDRADQAGITVREHRSTTLLTNAIAMRVSESQLARLRGLPGVAAVHQDRPVRAHVEHSVPLVGAPQVWDRSDADGRAVRGHGTTVAILDTGVDYTNPSLGGGFGPGRRVVGGYDFANGDADPMDDNGHGTHVAGIVAGNGAVTGVAPEAELTAYKVLDGDGAGYDSWILAGIEAAVDPANPHRADVINMSLGAPGDGTDLIGRAATAATEAGVVVVASAGNSGPAAQTIGSPAAADGVISVGASVSGLRLPTARLEEPVQAPLQTYRAGVSAGPPAQPLRGEVVDVGMGGKEELDRAGDLRGKIVMMIADPPETPEWTSPSFIEQARELERRGVLAALTYPRGGAGPMSWDATTGTATGTVGGDAAGEVLARPGTQDSGDSFRLEKLVVLGMDPNQRDELTRHLAAGPVRVSISGTDATDRLASFSSRGPSDRFTLEPDLTAPGVEIRSTWPTRQWAPGEFRLSGTSMAGPHVAGAAALLRQARPTLSVPDLRSALVGSAKPLADLGPTEQGAGRLDVAAAVVTEVVAEPATLSLGLADMSGTGTRASGTVRVRNLGDKPAAVRFGATRAGGSIGTVEVTPDRATIPAGGAVTVTVRVVAGSVDLARDSELSGWLTADLPGDADLRVPYLLAVRPLIVHSTPDPSDGRTEAFVFSPAPLRGEPTVRVVPRRGKPFEVVARHDHDSWYRAEIEVEKDGVYRVEARAATATGQRLIGADAFEVVPPENRTGGDRWEMAGPNSSAWQLTTIPNAPQRGILTTSASAALWLTDNRGESWQRVDRLPVARGGRASVVVDPRDDQRIWYAVNGRSGGALNHLFDPTYQGKILFTENRGRTWTTLDFPDTHIYHLLSTTDGRALIAVTADGFHLSHDRGRTWTAYPQDWDDALVSAAISGNTLVVATLRTVFAVPGMTGGPQPARRVHESGTDQVRGLDANDDRTIAVRSDRTVWGATDPAGQWQQLGILPGSGAGTLELLDGDTYAGGFAEDYVSRDGGRTWTIQAKPVRGPMDSDFDRWPGQPGTVLVSAERGGLFRTADGGASYTRLGVPGLTAYDLVVGQGADGAPALVVSTDSDSYRRPLPTGQLRPTDTEWGTAEEGRLTGTESLLAGAARDPRVMWKSLAYPFSAEDELQRSTDGGATWTANRRVWGRVTSLHVHPADTNRVVAGIFDAGYGFGLAVTRDGGTTWKNLYHDHTFTAVAGDPARPDRLWLGTADGLYRSDDLGQTITKVGGAVDAVYVGADGRVVAGGEQIRVSDNGGRTFAVADTGGLPMRVSDIVAVPGKPRTLYAGTDAHVAYGLPRNGRGVLRSTDGGRTWQNISGGLQAASVTSLAVSPDGRWLFAGTVDAGAHRLRIR
ncbi:S8 family serine peptidase [Micromonospora sp. WMMD1102]|uniref:S8 family serine peptidase n=1 Tax=Micromonospora sp. WMMD1102 TaxID=3016105 RepID=UPI002415362F|nr:S8 family serine peptidase [Micromonospora sp. WMMD1102]MDG4791510.1 S8 family serine peptidase [Micromonospora sp. WMMD1102]